MLFLNIVFIVRVYEVNFYKNKGWEIFIDRVIFILSECEDLVIFVLWGSNVCKKVELIDISKYYILEVFYLSLLLVSKGFFGCKYFFKINEILKKLGKEFINW